MIVIINLHGKIKQEFRLVTSSDNMDDSKDLSNGDDRSGDELFSHTNRAVCFNYLMDYPTGVFQVISVSGIMFIAGTSKHFSTLL